MPKIVAAQEGGEAPKGACRPCAASRRRVYATRLCAAARHIGARPPSGAPPRLSQGLPSLLSSRPCFLGRGIKRALPALSCPSAVTAPHASVLMPKGMMPEAAPARVASPRGSTALAPHFRIASGMRPSMSEILYRVTERGTFVKSIVSTMVTAEQMIWVTCHGRASPGLSRPSRLGGQGAKGVGMRGS